MKPTRGNQRRLYDPHRVSASDGSRTGARRYSRLGVVSWEATRFSCQIRTLKRPEAEGRSPKGVRGRGHLFAKLWSRRLGPVCLGLFAFNFAPPPAPAAIHSGVGDTSTAVAIDEDFMFTADDETQILRLYSRRFNGPPLWQQDFTANLGLTDRNNAGVLREVDIEASVRVGNRIYWLGSHGNCGGCNPPGEVRPNRNRLFATDIIGSGANARLVYVGRYHNLKTDLIAWDNTNGHGLGARRLQLQASAAAGVPPENEARTGFNIEGLSMSPTGTVAYIGFRSPLTPASGRSNALVIPLLNLPDLVQGSPARGPARFSRPIEMALEVRGVRSMDSSSNGVVIVAGTTTNTGASYIFSWTGRTNDPPRERRVNFTVAQPEAVIADGAFAQNTLIQLIAEGVVDFRSEFVLLGPSLPHLASASLTGSNTVRFSILGRSGAVYDIEGAGNDWSWRFLQQVQMPLGPMFWTTSTLPSNGTARFFRVRYPSSR